MAVSYRKLAKSKKTIQFFYAVSIKSITDVLEEMVMANPAALMTLPAVVVTEAATDLVRMVSDIANYKRAIAELELQRQHMRYQAQIAMQQIDAQLQTELKRIDSLNVGFKKMRKLNQQLIQSETANRKQTMQMLQHILLAVTQSQDLQHSQMMAQMYSTTMDSLNQSGQTMAALGQSIHDAHHMFGIAVSRRDQDWQDVN